MHGPTRASKTGCPPRHAHQWLFKIPWCWRRGTETLAQTAQQHCPLWCSPLHDCHAWWKGLCHPTSLQQAATRLHFLKQCQKQSQSVTVVTQRPSDCNFVNIGLSYNLKKQTNKTQKHNMYPKPLLLKSSATKIPLSYCWSHEWHNMKMNIFILLRHSIHICQYHMPSYPFLSKSLRWDFYCA